MLNKIQLIGRITHNLECDYVTSKKENETFAKVSFQLAVKPLYKENDKTQFISCVAFRKKAEHLYKFLRKGSRIYVEGSLSIQEYQNSEGLNLKAAKVIVQEIIFLDSKTDSSSEFKSGSAS